MNKGTIEPYDEEEMTCSMFVKQILQFKYVSLRIQFLVNTYLLVLKLQDFNANNYQTY